MNFKEYFSQEKKPNSILNMGTGSKQHQTVGRMMNIGNRKKGLNFIAKSQSQNKKSEHPKIDLCLRTKKDIPLTPNDAFEIMDKFNSHPTPTEKIKHFKKLPVSIEYIKPQVYVLRYNKDQEGKWKL